VLYELLGGKPPFDFGAATPAEIEQSILHRVPKTPDPHQQDLSAIALKALRKLSSERYASVAELSEDLRRFLTHRPISARSGQFWYRTQKFLRRNALAVAASTAFTATVTGFAWHAYSQQIEIAKQRDLAVEEKQNAEAVTGFLVESFTPSDPSESFTEASRIEDYFANAGQQLERVEFGHSTLRSSIGLSLLDASLRISSPTATKRLISYLDANAKILNSEQANQLLLLRARFTQYYGSMPEAREAVDAYLRKISADSLPQSSALSLEARLLDWEQSRRESGFDGTLPHFLNPEYWPKNMPQKLEEQVQIRFSEVAASHRFRNKQWAYDVLKKLVAKSRSTFGLHHTSQLKRRLAYIASDLSRHDEAEKLILDALEETEQVFGKSSRSYRGTLSGVGAIYEAKGDLVNAAKMYRTCVELEQKNPKKTSEDLLMYLTNLSSALSQSHSPGAKESNDEALELAVKVFGKTHPRTKALMAVACQMSSTKCVVQNN
jgi:tetratricopeptide (TPR) repeat protein